MTWYHASYEMSSLIYSEKKKKKVICCSYDWPFKGEIFFYLWEK